MKHQSLQKKLLHLTTLLLGSVLFCLALLIVCFHLLFHQIKTTINQQNQYISYISSVKNLQNSVAGYFDSPSAEKLTVLNERKETFIILAKNILTFFQSAQFEDAYLLSNAYVNAVNDLTERLSSSQEDDSFQLYKQCVHLYDLVLKQHETTLSFEMTELANRLSIVTTDWNLFTGFIIAFICIIFFQIILIASGIIKKISAPLIRLTIHAQAIEEQNYSDSIENLLHENNYSEICVLTAAFIQMETTIRQQIEELNDKLDLSQKIHALELENMSAQIALAQTENSLMQSLINPHFLFNCLNLLSSFAIIEKAPMVQNYALKIAQYLRESLNYVGKAISLQNEFSFLKHYAEIQKIRFGDRITFQFHCDDNCHDAVIPAVILQPLVENSLVHGVVSYIQNGQIYVHATRIETNLLQLTVEDNGEGFSDDQLTELSNTLHQPFEAGQKGTGLRSVIYRLNYFFDGQIDFRIESNNKLTQIILLLPYKTSLDIESKTLQEATFSSKTP